MINKIVISFCFALSFYVGVCADQEVKRGVYPFMAFVYYSDDKVLDETGARYIRSAVLIRADWLVSSAIGPNTSPDEPTGYPKKTLLARAGAVDIDANFTLNEDDDEQEREIIQVVRPFNDTGISLLKTLMPFRINAAVGFTTLVYNQGNVDKTCTILLYAPRDGDANQERYLIKLSVELLNPPANECGQHYVQDKMLCALDSDDNKYTYSPNYCRGNSGGPLICNGDVTGLQIYINNDCKPPHLYQLLSAWESFISCSVEEKCDKEQCTQMCNVVNKDMPIHTQKPTITTPQSEMTQAASADDITDTTKTMQDTSYVEDNVQLLVPTLTPRTLNASNESMTSLATTLRAIDAEPISVNSATVDLRAVEITTLTLTTPNETSTTNTTVEPSGHGYTNQTSTEDYAVSSKISKDNNTEDEIDAERWPKEKSIDNRRAMDNIDENAAMSSKIEAQEQNVKVKKSASTAIVFSHSLILGYLIVTCLI